MRHGASTSLRSRLRCATRSTASLRIAPPPQGRTLHTFENLTARGFAQYQINGGDSVDGRPELVPKIIYNMKGIESVGSQRKGYNYIAGNPDIPSPHILASDHDADIDVRYGAP